MAFDILQILVGARSILGPFGGWHTFDDNCCCFTPVLVGPSASASTDDLTDPNSPYVIEAGLAIGGPGAAGNVQVFEQIGDED